MLKRELQARADELNIDYKQNDTKADLKEMIEEKEAALEEENLEVEKEENSKKEETTSDNKEILVKATRNTFLPDGKFIEKGQTITVNDKYAEIIKDEQSPAFKIIN